VAVAVVVTAATEPVMVVVVSGAFTVTAPVTVPETRVVDGIL
jgi:hypothetical protein